MPDRIITFEYARQYYDFFKKQTIPNSKECMTKQDVNDYIQVNPNTLTSYVNNRLVPRFRVLGEIQNFTGSCYNFNGAVLSIAMQSDGKLLVGGAFTKYKDTNCNRLIRLNLDGSVDTTFLSNMGSGFTNLESTDPVYETVVTKILIQNDGKILIGGTFDKYNGSSYYSLIRLNSNGTIDSSFNVGYNVSFYVSSVNWNVGRVTDMLIYNNQVYVIGHFENKRADNTILDHGTSVFNLSNGSKDYTKGSPCNSSNCDFSHITSTIIRASDGYFTIVSNDRIVRVNYNFNIPSTMTMPLGQYVRCLTYDTYSGDWVVGGIYTTILQGGVTSSNPVNITRYHNNGGAVTVVGSFTTNYHNTVPNSTKEIIAIKADGNGKIYVFQAEFSSTTTGVLIRINSDGTYDSSFTPVSILNKEIDNQQYTYEFWYGAYEIMISNSKVYLGGQFLSDTGTLKNKNMLKTTLSGVIDCGTDVPPITYMYLNNYYNNPCMISYEIYQGSDNIIYVNDSGFMLPITNYPNSWYQFNTVIDSNTYEWRKYNSSLIQIGTETSSCGVQ